MITKNVWFQSWVIIKNKTKIASICLFAVCLVLDICKDEITWVRNYFGQQYDILTLDISMLKISCLRLKCTMDISDTFECHNYKTKTVFHRYKSQKVLNSCGPKSEQCPRSVTVLYCFVFTIFFSFLFSGDCGSQSIIRPVCLLYSLLPSSQPFLSVQ